MTAIGLGKVNKKVATKVAGETVRQIISLAIRAYKLSTFPPRWSQGMMMDLIVGPRHLQSGLFLSFPGIFLRHGKLVGCK
jgi:hypothetical protein